MSFATEGFSAMMSFLVTGRERPRKATQALGPALREAQNDMWNRKARQGTAARFQRGQRRPLAESVYLPTIRVRDQLVENQRVDVAAACPQDHQDYDFELVGADRLARQRHRPLDDELTQERSEYLRAFEECNESSALQRQLGRFFRGVSAEGRSRVERFWDPVVGRTREAVEPVEGVVNIVVLEASRVELSFERVVIRIGLCGVVVLKQVYQYVEHVPSTDALV